MSTLELIALVMAAFSAFWLFVWLGSLIARTPKLFYYGKFRKFLN